MTIEKEENYRINIAWFRILNIGLDVVCFTLFTVWNCLRLNKSLIYIAVPLVSIKCEFHFYAPHLLFGLLCMAGLSFISSTRKNSSNSIHQWQSHLPMKHCDYLITRANKYPYTCKDTIIYMSLLMYSKCNLKSFTIAAFDDCRLYKKCNAILNNIVNRKWQ